MFKLRKGNTVLFIILFIILGNIIFYYPKVGFSPVPTEWTAGSGFGRMNIIQNGNIPAYEVTTTWPSSIVNYATVDILPKILAATINIITGTTKFPDSEQFHHIFSWVGILFLPIVVLYFYKYMAEKRWNGIDILILYLFSMFPLAAAIPSMSDGASAGNAVAIVFFMLLLVLLVIIHGEKEKKREIAIFIFLLFPFFYYYHTWSYYLIIYFVSIIILSILYRDNIHIVKLSILGIILFFVAALYYNNVLFDEPMRIIGSIPRLLVNFPYVSYTMKINSEYFGYKSLGTTYSYMQLIDALLLVSIYLIFIFKYMQERNHKSYENMLFYFVMAQFIIMIALFAWDGILAIYQRILESSVYVSMLLASYLLFKSGPKLKVVIRLLMLCAVFLTIVSCLTYPKESNWQLTNEEFSGIIFTGEHIHNNKFIFSDFRLAPPLIYFNKSFMPIDGGSTLPEMTEEILKKSYYNVSNPETVLDKYLGSKDYYVVTSLHQTEVDLLDSSLQMFKPADVNFQNRWSEQNNFSKIYSSMYFNMFERSIK